MSRLEELCSKYPIRNKEWVHMMGVSIEFFQKVSGSKSVLICLDPWNRRFPKEAYKVWALQCYNQFITTVEGIAVVCRIYD